MEQYSLLNSQSLPPLAEQLRPKKLEEVFGQSDVLSGSIAKMLEAGKLQSLILWGSPGCGKTTIAKIIAAHSKLNFVIVSAVTSNIAELKDIFAKAKLQKTLLLVDEIHRFNRSQQDIFLPYIEDGSIILIGATTENPSFELNSALLSRCRILVLNRLDEIALEQIICRAEEKLQKSLPIDADARQLLITMADGDGRYLLGLCEELFLSEKVLNSLEITNYLQKRAPIYDKSNDSHYNLISALHKSIRGSDPEASLYWLARMLSGGENPSYILRRLARLASEDIGLADPLALGHVMAARETFEFLGAPEGELAIAQAVIYLALAPKSNACYLAYKQMQKLVKETASLMPPKHILNAPTKLMKDQNYGQHYIYDHDTEEGFSGQNYFPDKLERTNFYQPKERGFEREILKRINYFNNLRANK